MRTLLAGLVALFVSAAPLQSQSSGDRSCRVVGSVLGGFAGFFVGGAIGGRLEQAIYEGEDAGLTGVLLGGFGGMVIGIMVAQGACDDSSEVQHRVHLGQHLGRLDGALGIPLRSGATLPAWHSSEMVGTIHSTSLTKTGDAPLADHGFQRLSLWPLPARSAHR